MHESFTQVSFSSRPAYLEVLSVYITEQTTYLHIFHYPATQNFLGPRHASCLENRTVQRLPIVSSN